MDRGQTTSDHINRVKKGWRDFKLEGGITRFCFTRKVPMRDHQRKAVWEYSQSREWRSSSP